MAALESLARLTLHVAVCGEALPEEAADVLLFLSDGWTGRCSTRFRTWRRGGIRAKPRRMCCSLLGNALDRGSPGGIRIRGWPGRMHP